MPELASAELRGRSIVTGLITVSAAATLILVAVVAFRPTATASALHWYLLTLGSFTAVALFQVITRAYPGGRRSAFDLALAAHRQPTERPERLRTLEGRARISQIDSAGFQVWLLPVLRDIASYRLASRCRIAVGTDPAAARRVLGPQIYDLLWGPESDGRDRLRPGKSLSELQTVLHALEEL